MMKLKCHRKDGHTYQHIHTHASKNEKMNTVKVSIQGVGLL